MAMGSFLQNNQRPQEPSFTSHGQGKLRPDMILFRRKPQAPLKHVHHHLVVPSPSRCNGHQVEDCCSIAHGSLPVGVILRCLVERHMLAGHGLCQQQQQHHLLLLGAGHVQVVTPILPWLPRAVSSNSSTTSSCLVLGTYKL